MKPVTPTRRSRKDDRRARLLIICGVVSAAGSAAYAQDFAEGNAAQWGTFASDHAPAGVADDATHVKAGSSAILFTTQSGFDTGVKYPAAGGLNLDASGFNYLVFWEYPENSTPIGWQDVQPVVVIRTGTGTMTLTPTQQLTPNFAWRLFKVPLAGGAGWDRTTTGTPDLSDVDQIEIHHDTWDAGFRIWFDGVRFMHLDPTALPPPGPPPPPGVDPDRIEPRVLLWVFDPIMEIFGSRRMHEVYGWQDPVELASQIVADYDASSHGRVHFKIVETRVVDEYPRFQDGFQHTDETFAYDWEHRIFHDSTFDYVGFVNGNGIGQRVDDGDVDEVWVYAPPIGGMWESAMAGHGAYWINGAPYPDAGGDRAFVVMGWNFERGVGEAIHSWGHRAESVMVHSYGSWPHDRSNTWGRFALLDRDAPGLGGVGNVHFPVNADSDYDYANTRFVQSNADAWLAYPNLTETTRALNFHEWSPDEMDPQRQYLNWWYGHMPHVAGRAPDYFLANWWRYLIDVDQFKGWDGNLYLSLGIPSVRLTFPEPGSGVTGAVNIRAAAEVDGALGRVDFYIDGLYAGTDTLAPYTLVWDTAGLCGVHTLVAKAYELQNGTEGVSQAVEVITGCAVDFNCDGLVDFADYLEFLNIFDAIDPRADLNGDGVVDFGDFLEFLNHYDAGC